MSEASCACTRVAFSPRNHGSGLFSERWVCTDCGREFKKHLSESLIDTKTADTRPCVRCGDTREPIEVPCEDPRCEDYRACVERAKRISGEPVTEPGRPVPRPDIGPDALLEEFDRIRIEASLATPRTLAKSDNGFRWCFGCATPVSVSGHEC